MMKNVSKPVLLSLTFPLPPLGDQRALIDALDSGRTEAARLRGDATAARAAARTAFEATIYGADDASKVIKSVSVVAAVNSIAF